MMLKCPKSGLDGDAENAGVENCRSDDGWRAISIENYKIPVV